MAIENPKSLLVRVAHLVAERNYTSATGGNLSVRAGDGTFWLTPSQLHKARVELADLVRVDADCNLVEGTRKPSSESLMHLAIYSALPQAQAVIHAHPPVSTAFGLACKPIDTSASSEALAILGPQVPLIRYARPSTGELADVVAAAMRPRHKAYVMANHGVITWGADLWDAYDMLDTLEMFAQSLVAAHLIGGPVALSTEERAWLEKKAGY